ncbi:IS3 family transposase [Lysinibacillus sp. M3]|uniref:IS3 family transposase n=1 Tax=Lysinibacillus zambalensis TaxID=3160866 RepID=A0ABV1MZ83_9BACI
MFTYGKCLFKKVESLSSRKRCIQTKEKVRAVYELRLDFPLQALLKVARLKKSTYYYHLQKWTKPDKYQEIKERIQTLFHHHKGRYGYRRICLALRNEGILINHKTVQRLMKELSLKGTVRPKKYRSYKGTVGYVAENVLQRDFQATEPNQKWVTDVTEFKINGQKIYCSAVLNLFNGEIVGYEVSKSPNFELVQQSFKKAFAYAKLPEKSDLIIHSDQGWLSPLSIEKLHKKVHIFGVGSLIPEESPSLHYNQLI